MKKTEDILSMFPARLVESRTFEYNGKKYYLPYETIIINEKIDGLRKNTQWAEIFDKIIENEKVQLDSHLDVGSNLGFFVDHFSRKFQNNFGVEMESFYVDMCNTIYPNLNGRFINKNLNQTTLSEIFGGEEKFNLITALSMIEYINDKKKFVDDLYNLTKQICIVEGHSEDIQKGLDKEYESLLREKKWEVQRSQILTEPGLNAPNHQQVDLYGFVKRDDKIYTKNKNNKSR